MPRSTLRIPDSALCRDALELARETVPEFLFNHSVRVFLLARLIGAARGVRADEELLLVGCALHDVGLGERFDGDARFEVEGADAAHALCRRHGVDEKRAELVWDAIALHTSAGIAHRKGPEIALLHLGAGADLVGVHLDEVDDADVDAVMGAHPRGGDVMQRFFACVAEQAAHKPQKAPGFSLPGEVARQLAGHPPPPLTELAASSRYHRHPDTRGPS